jgi:THO complex subunit 5
MSSKTTTLPDPSNLIHDTDLRDVLTTTSRLRTQAFQLLDLQSQLVSLTSSSTNGDGPSADSSSDSSTLKNQISMLQTKMLATNARLRAQHRAAIMSTRETKGRTSEARQEVDSLSLLLQNLVYEQRHLKNEIVACESFEFVTSELRPLLIDDLAIPTCHYP